MKTLVPLSPTEWRLMRCVWDLRQATPPQVADHLRTKLGEELSPKTVGIFLARLEEKGYLRSSPGPTSAVRGRPAHVYSPSVAHEDSLRRQLQKFLDDHLIDKGTLEAFLSSDMAGPVDVPK
jgi:predicted transcriptional regulator